MSEGQNDEGFEIHPASIAISIQRPEYKPLIKKQDPTKIQEKESLIMEILQYGSDVFEKMNKKKSCCFSSSDLDIDKLDVLAISQGIRKKIRSVLDNLLILDGDEQIMFLEGISLACIYQEARKSEFLNFYKTRTLPNQISAIKTSIGEYKKSLGSNEIKSLNQVIDGILNILQQSLKLINNP